MNLERLSLSKVRIPASGRSEPVRNLQWLSVSCLVAVLLFIPAESRSIIDLESDYTMGGELDFALTWGGEATYDRGNKVAVDINNNVYVVGIFSFAVDFDPGSSVALVEKHNAFFLSKFNSSGDFQWVRTWDGSAIWSEPSVATDNFGNIFVAGWYSGSEVDLDPTRNVESYTAIQSNAFLYKFDASGNFHWLKTWGGEWWAEANDLDTDNAGNIYIAGCFGGRADMDPGPEVAEYEASGRVDSYLLMLNSSGEFRWVQTWGGEGGEGVEREAAYDVKFGPDGNLYVTGAYNGSVDFDPSSSWDGHESLGCTDAYFSKLDADGNQVWTKTWGGEGEDFGYSLGFDGVGNIYVGGFWGERVAFNPARLRERRQAANVRSVFLTKFDSDGNHQWARGWGTSMEEDDIGIAVSSDGSVGLAGKFFLNGDLRDEITEEEYTDLYLLRIIMCGFDADGNLTMTCPLERFGPSYGRDVALDSTGSYYITGAYDHSVDFDPEFGWQNVDERTTAGNLDIFLIKYVPD